jgi:hypothetical protein
MGSPKWETPDVQKMIDRREEAVTSANVGSFEVPLGEPLRRVQGAQDAYNDQIPPEYLKLFGLDPETP